MPDLSPLPPLGDAPRFAPSDERFAAAARTARRRRAVRTSVPAGAVAAALVAAVVTTTASTPSGLRPVTPGTSPSPTESASPMPTPAAVGGSATGSPAPAPASYAPTPGTEPSAAPTTPPPAEESATPSPTRRAVYVSPRPYGSTPPPERNQQAGIAYQPLQPRGCGGAWGPPDGGWCARYSGPGTLRSGQFAIFQFEICRTASTAGDIVFAGERELEFALEKGADRADAGGYTSRPGSGPHYVTVGSGSCAQWKAPWDMPDLPPGTYDLVWALSGERPVLLAPEQRQVTVVEP